MPTVRTLHNSRQENLNPTEENQTTATHIGIGSDGTAKSVTDDGLDSETLISPIAQSSRNGNSLTLRAFIDSTQGNGTDIREVSLEGDGTGSTTLAVEALPSGEQIGKDSSTTVTIDITITTEDESEI